MLVIDTRYECGEGYLGRPLVLFLGNNDGCSASSGMLPASELESGRTPRVSGQGRKLFTARRALRSTAFQLAAAVIITGNDYQGRNSHLAALPGRA